MLPWQNTTAHDEREAFIAAWQEGEETVAALAHHFGVSRKTAHKFINRFRAVGPDGLLDRSRAPRAPHNATPQEVVDLLIQAKRADVALGPKKLVPLLRAAYPHLRWPAPSTAGGILDRAGLVRLGGVGAARPLPASRPPQRLLVHRLQGLGPHRRRRPHRPPHHPGRPLPLPARLSGAAPPRLPPGPSRLRAHLPRVRTAPRHPLRQRAALRQHRPRRPDAARRLVRQARRDPGAHPAGTPRTERPPRALPPYPERGGPQPCRAHPGPAAAGLRLLPLPVQPPAAARGLGPDAPGGPLPPLATTLSPHGREPGLRRRRDRPPRPEEWGDQVGRGAPLPERGPHRRAGGARPTRRPLLDGPVRPLGDRPAGRPPKEYPAHPRHGVTYVPGRTKGGPFPAPASPRPSAPATSPLPGRPRLLHCPRRSNSDHAPPAGVRPGPDRNETKWDQMRPFRKSASRRQ